MIAAWIWATVGLAGTAGIGTNCRVVGVVVGVAAGVSAGVVGVVAGVVGVMVGVVVVVVVVVVEPPPPPPPPPPPLVLEQGVKLGDKTTVELPSVAGPVRVMAEEPVVQVAVNPPSFPSVYRSAEVKVMLETFGSKRTKVRVMMLSPTIMSSTSAPEVTVKVMSGLGPVSTTLPAAS